MPRRTRWMETPPEELERIIRVEEERLKREEPLRKAEAAQREAEIARRASLQPIERLAEDGVKLRQRIESNDDMIAVLEVSRSARAGCRAGDCFYAPRIDSIRDQFRIRVEGDRGEFEPSHYRAKHYYHVLCFEAMMDLEELIPSGKFVCCADESWGLLVRMWFQHRGRINEEVLVDYIKEREEWDKKRYGGLPPALIRALFGDTERREASEGTEGVTSTSASAPETAGKSRKEDDPPILRDYLNDESWVSLFRLLQLPEIGAGRMHFVQDPQRPLMLRAVDPWSDAYGGVEAEQHGPKTEEEVGMEIERQRNRQDEKREELRMIWDVWHPGATEASAVLDALDGDAPKQVEGAGEGKKRRRSPSDGAWSKEKRQKVQGGEDMEGEE